VASAMTPALERLVALARLDARLQGLEQSLHQLPERENKAKARLAAAKAALESHKDRVKQLERARRESESEVESLVAQERKYQGQTMQVKTNEELWALQKEIAGVRGRRSELETSVLERMEEEAGKRRETPALERTVAEARAHLEAEIQSVEEERERLGAERQARAAERDRVLAELPPDLAARSGRVRQSRGNPAVVRLMRNACGGCLTAQPPQRVQEVRAGDLMVICEFCGRLIVGAEADAPRPA